MTENGKNQIIKCDLVLTIPICIKVLPARHTHTHTHTQKKNLREDRSTIEVIWADLRKSKCMRTMRLLELFRILIIVLWQKNRNQTDYMSSNLKYA